MVDIIRAELAIKWACARHGHVQIRTAEGSRCERCGKPFRHA